MCISTEQKSIKLTQDEISVFHSNFWAFTSEIIQWNPKEFSSSSQFGGRMFKYLNHLNRESNPITDRLS